MRRKRKNFFMFSDAVVNYINFLNVRLWYEYVKTLKFRQLDFFFKITEKDIHKIRFLSTGSAKSALNYRSSVT